MRSRNEFTGECLDLRTRKYEKGGGNYSVTTFKVRAVLRCLSKSKIGRVGHVARMGEMSCKSRVLL
jgi:hypothetical protein